MWDIGTHTHTHIVVLDALPLQTSPTLEYCGSGGGMALRVYVQHAGIFKLLSLSTLSAPASASSGPVQILIHKIMFEFAFQISPSRTRPALAVPGKVSHNFSRLDQSDKRHKKESNWLVGSVGRFCASHVRETIARRTNIRFRMQHDLNWVKRRTVMCVCVKLCHQPRADDAPDLSDVRRGY